METKIMEYISKLRDEAHELKKYRNFRNVHVTVIEKIKLLNRIADELEALTEH